MRGPAFLRGLADGPVPRIVQLEEQGFVTRTRFWYQNHQPLGLCRTFSRAGGKYKDSRLPSRERFLVECKSAPPLHAERIRVRVTRAVPLWPPTPQGCCGIQREQNIRSWFGVEIFYDTITISIRGLGACSHGRSRPHMHTLTSLVHSVPLHTLPLTTILAACCVPRCWFARSNLLELVDWFCARQQRVRCSRCMEQLCFYRCVA